MRGAKAGEGVEGVEWGGVYVIAGFTECSRRKLLARTDDVRYNIYTYIYIYITIPRSAVKLGWLAPARQLSISNK